MRYVVMEVPGCYLMLASGRLAQDRIVILAGDVFGLLKHGSGAGHRFQTPTMATLALLGTVGYRGVANSPAPKVSPKYS